MTGNDSSESGGLGLEIELGQVVKDVYRYTGYFEHVGDGNLTSPGSAIDVAADCGYRRNLRQLVEDSRIADVSGVDDVV